VQVKEVNGIDYVDRPLLPSFQDVVHASWWL